jgi:hypothetical protein
MGVVLACGAAAAAAQTGGYRNDFTKVYRTYQTLLAHKEACDESVPDRKAAIEQGYASWRLRNDRTVAELQDRLAAMIRAASQDEREYVRNFGKYEGVLLQQRREAKEALLNQPRDELKALCDALPALLAGRDADLETLYGEELKNLRRRR